MVEMNEKHKLRNEVNLGKYRNWGKPEMETWKLEKDENWE